MGSFKILKRISDDNFVCHAEINLRFELTRFEKETQIKFRVRLFNDTITTDHPPHAPCGELTPGLFKINCLNNIVIQ